MTAARGVGLLLVLAACRSAESPVAPATGEREQARSHASSDLDSAILRIQSGDLDAGLAELDALLASAPENAVACEARRWRGHALTRLGDPKGALRDYRAALELAPDDPWLHYACGISASTMGELDAALADFSRAIERDPAHFKALQWRGETRLLLGEPGLAVGDLTRAIEAIDAASDEALAHAGTSLRDALSMTLALRIEALEALGEHDEAERDRTRRAALLGER